MALYALAEVFPAFLAYVPRKAASALVAIMKSYVAHAHASVFHESIEESFDFNGTEAWICTDYSSIWDTGSTYQHRDPLKLLNAFEQYLQHLAAQGESAGELHELVEVLIKENRLAVLWRRLLSLGTQFPNTLGSEILPLAWARPILMGRDTSALAGEFLTMIFPALSLAERERIERVLLSVPDVFVRNRLLGCLTEANLVTTETRQLLATLRATNTLPPNQPPIRFENCSDTYSEENFLVDGGGSIYTEAHREIRSLEQSVKEFVDKHLNAVPTLAEAAAILPSLQTLRLATLRSDADAVCDSAWRYLTAACGRLAKMETLSCEDAIGAFTQEVLLEASYHAEPLPHPEHDAQFDEKLSMWGSNTARFEAAEGLMLLARHVTCTTNEVRHAIERLSTDPVPSIRFQIASRLNALYHTASELMWRLIEHFCHEEPRRGVLQGLLSGPLDRLSSYHTDHVVHLTKAIYDRVSEGPGAHEVRGLCIDLFTVLYVRYNHATCREIIFSIMAHLLLNPDDIQRIPLHLRAPLTYSPVHPPDPIQSGVRHRAFDLMARLLQTAHHEFDDVQAAHLEVPFNAWPVTDQKNAQILARLIDDIGMQLYFASGAYGAKTQGGRMPLSPEEQQRFYDEARGIFDELAEVGLPSVAHHLLETLEAFIPLDPKGVFLRIGRVVRSGQKGLYEYESLAVGLIVRLVELYLADHQAIFQQDEECRQTLREILDIFVQVGWPEAQRLTYRLEEIFR
jgi:hypothetical protein